MIWCVSAERGPTSPVSSLPKQKQTNPLSCGVIGQTSNPKQGATSLQCGCFTTTQCQTKCSEEVYSAWGVTTVHTQHVGNCNRFLGVNTLLRPFMPQINVFLYGTARHLMYHMLSLLSFLGGIQKSFCSLKQLPIINHDNAEWKFNVLDTRRIRTNVNYLGFPSTQVGPHSQPTHYSLTAGHAEPHCSGPYACLCYTKLHLSVCTFSSQQFAASTWLWIGMRFKLWSYCTCKRNIPFYITCFPPPQPMRRSNCEDIVYTRWSSRLY